MLKSREWKQYGRAAGEGEGELREGCGKSKWKFKMAFAMKGGGTMGENHSFWLLKRFLIFQGISGDLDANLLKHISLKIQ